MSNGRHRTIRISRIEGEPGTYVATFTAAVALHCFADMIASDYGGKVSLQIPDEILPIPNKAVSDILSSIGEN